MQLIHPAFFYLAFLAIVPLALYFFRRKSRKIDVSTLVFFKALAREHQESAWLRRLKKLLSLVLTLLVLSGVIFALVQVIFSPKADAVKHVVILLDRSASMAAEDAEGKTRMDQAREEISTRLDGLPKDIAVALVVYDSRPEIEVPRTLKRRELLSRLDAMEVRPVSGNAQAALSSATLLAQLETPSVIWHYSDAPIEPPKAVTDDEGENGDPAQQEGTLAAAAAREVAPEEEVDAAAGEALTAVESPLPAGVSLEFNSVALSEPLNVGITSFRIRRVPLVHSKFEAFVQVSCNGAANAGETIPARIEVTIGGVLALPPRQLDLKPGTSERLSLPLQGAEDQMLKIEVLAEGDCLEYDNAVLEPLPRSRPIVAAWISANPDPFTELALSAVQEEGELQLWKGSPEKSWPLAAPVDVVIFDGWLPDEWPTDIPAIVVNPPGNAGPVKAAPIGGGGVPHDHVRVTNAQHPVLFRVSSGRVALTQTCVFDSSGSLEPLWFAGNEPVLSAGEVNGQRLVIMGFSAELSEQLPLTASYPLLMGNAILWCAENSPSVVERVQEYRTGEVVEVGGDEIRWSTPSSGRILESVQKLTGSLVELDRVGVWQSGEGRKGVAHLLSLKETDVPAHQAAGADGGAGVKIGEAQAGWLNGDITWLMLAVVILALLLESWLFHWHSVY